MDLMELIEPKFEFFTCPRCRTCTITEAPDYEEACPSYWEFKYFSHAAGGRLKIGRGLYEGRIEMDDDVADVIYRCTLCSNCKRCGLGITPVEDFEMLRKAYVKQKGVYKKHKPLIDSIRKYDNAWAQPRSARIKWAKNQNVPLYEGQKVLFYVGCTSSFDPVFRDMALSASKVMNRLGVDFGILGKEEVCCGSPVLRVGDIELFESLAKRNLEVFNDLGADTIVSTCSGCFKTLLQDYPSVGKINQRVIHITQFFEELFEENNIKLKLPDDGVKKVTYHDPCHLGRHCGVFDAPRNLIKSVEGIELVEMDRNRDDSWCCGAGGGVKVAFPQFAANTAKKRNIEARKTGADAIVSSCPFCEQNLAENDPEMKVMDITALLLDAME